MKYRTEKEKKFNEVYSAHATDVYRVCLYFTKDKVVAQELAQQTFVNFYEHFDEVAPEYRKEYLVRSARDFVIKWRKESNNKDSDKKASNKKQDSESF